MRVLLIVAQAMQTRCPPLANFLTAGIIFTV